MFSVLNIVVERGESDSTLAGNSGKGEPPAGEAKEAQALPAESASTYAQ